ncbi:patatin-like phospholipase family protein [Lysobacter soli]|uniref:patatin-like phospholipase family protein n=1 Tax=Lysobacter soli TaxID=453783 RepID=UPI0020A02C48|nr:patatin-like phospholipase family protein [Lysobacter soli]UTA53232.1 patatin-like phospholipase family protein [Lysobacter soli]
MNLDPLPPCLVLARRPVCLARAVLLAVCAAWLVGCVTIPRNPVPADQTPVALIPGMPDARAFAGRPDALMQRDFEQSMEQESREDFPPDADGAVRYPHLALSGGGANGAFGAGFLNGWTRTGKRPVFKIVTGVSTGALMAPFAFLGSKYDQALHRFYTTTTAPDVFTAGSPLMALLRRDSLASTAPLEALIARHIDHALLRDVAWAHRRGRRLYVGTVDLDSRRFVVWNMGLIATYGTPAADDLFRRVMLASAAIPLVFPPVMFEVEANGKRYDEMHVDGFIGANVFMNSGIFNPTEIYRRAGRFRPYEDTFLIHNGQLHPRPKPTERSMRGIAMRVIETAGRAGMVGDLFREFAIAQRNGSNFHWVTIPEDIEVPDPILFDPAGMTALYDTGYDAALAGPQWLTSPPGMLVPSTPAE